jgi:hypothetical protein
MPAAPNLTNVKLRRKAGGVQMRQFQVDPYWGIPPGQPPLALDPTTGLVRPFSSYGTLATACANFIGFASDTFVPGENHSVWVELQGWVEMKLETASGIIAGTLYKPVLVDAATDYVSDDTVEEADSDEDPLGLFRAVQSCLCQPYFDPASCPGSVPVASDVSPTEALDRRLQRTVLLSFGV